MRITLNRAQEQVKSLDMVTACMVTKRAWIATVLDATRRSHDTVVDLYPALEDQEVLQQIRTEIERVEQLREQAGE